MEKTVNEIAQLVGGTVGSGASTVVHRLASLDEAGAGDLAFAVPPHIDAARAASAAALLLPMGTEGFTCPHIFVDDPKAAFAPSNTLSGSVTRRISVQMCASARG